MPFLTVPDDEIKKKGNETPDVDQKKKQNSGKKHQHRCTSDDVQIKNLAKIYILYLS